MAQSKNSKTGVVLKRFVPRVFNRTAPLPQSVAQLVKTVRKTHPKADINLIITAYKVAEQLHAGQFRHSGEPYITHPVAVTQILADLGVAPSVIVAGLLHDTVEDCDYTLEDLTRDFGSEVALLVDGVTKLDKVEYGSAAEAETVRKMIVAMTKDIRVLVIKIADRLHNARTWHFMPPEKAQKKAKETLEIFAPLAHRLGIQPVKTELEDLSFAVLKPKIYQEIKNLVAIRNPKREEQLAAVKNEINLDLAKAKISGVVYGRPKELYSIYQKMIVRGRDFDDIYDLVGVRVLVDSVRDCYAILGAVHARWTPIPGRFKDYIATPKFNLYQSLHTSVIGPSGKPVEIQIRTHEMHERAEFGVAAHWKYKQNPNLSSKVATKTEDMAWLAHINDWQRDTDDPSEFLDALRFEIGAKEVYVFTPKGRVIGLPRGGTPVDFAYAVHTEVGHRTMGAKINGKLLPLETVLKNGDVVEIITHKDPDAGPNKAWLNFARSRRAQAKIKQWFLKERREEAAESGKESLHKELRRRSVPLKRVLQSNAAHEVAMQMHFADVDAMLVAVGEGRISAQSVIDKLVTHIHDDDETQIETPITTEFVTSPGSARVTAEGIIVKGASDVLVKIAKCCTPVPGDQIAGFVTKGHGVSVHDTKCQNLAVLSEQDAEREIEVEWGDTKNSVFLVNIQVEALDRSGLLSDITKALSDNHVNILSASVHTAANRLALSKFSFEMGDITHLNQVLNSVRKVNGVYDVYRTQGF